MFSRLGMWEYQFSIIIIIIIIIEPEFMFSWLTIFTLSLICLSI
jgi:hypothetical protein